MRKFIITAAVAVLSMVALPTASSAEAVSISVQYSDLDLSTASGLATLEGRIERAASRICGRSEVRPLYKALAYKRCVAEVNNSARTEIARSRRSEPTVALGRH